MLVFRPCVYTNMGTALWFKLLYKLQKHKSTYILKLPSAVAQI